MQLQITFVMLPFVQLVDQLPHYQDMGVELGVFIY